MLSKKALSPLIATILLVVFALIVGTATMNWGKNYVESAPDEKQDSFMSSIVINMDLVDNPLKELQIKYLTDKLTLEEYLAKEEAAVNEINSQGD